jgi:uncharacterized protein (TIGR02145 family)
MEELKQEGVSEILDVNPVRNLPNPIFSMPEPVKCLDNQGRQYKTVVIGSQTWMAENLNVSTFRNGDIIPEAKTKEDWEQAGKNKQPAWCYYNNDPTNSAKFGILYNWYAVNDPRGLAPVGFHIPTDAEWDTLVTFLGGEDVAGKKMKSTSGWESYTSGGSKTCPNCKNWNAEYRSKVACHTCKDTRKVPAPKTTHSGNGSNSSGFSGLPGGYRSRYDGLFYTIGKNGYWWSSSEDNKYESWFLNLYGAYDFVVRAYGKESGCSVRCVKD